MVSMTVATRVSRSIPSRAASAFLIASGLNIPAASRTSEWSRVDVAGSPCARATLAVATIARAQAIGTYAGGGWIVAASHCASGRFPSDGWQAQGLCPVGSSIQATRLGSL